MVTDLQKRVIDARAKRNKRLKMNYWLAKGYGYTSEEAALLMNRSYKAIIDMGIKEGRLIDPDIEPYGVDADIYLGDMLPKKYYDYMEENREKLPSKAKDVTNSCLNHSVKGGYWYGE